MNHYAFVLLARVLAATILGRRTPRARARRAPCGASNARPRARSSLRRALRATGNPRAARSGSRGALDGDARGSAVPRWLDLATPGAGYVLAKLTLLAITLGLAIDARLRVVPTLRAETLNALASYAAITTTAVLFVVAGVGLHTGGFFP